MSHSMAAMIIDDPVIVAPHVNKQKITKASGDPGVTKVKPKLQPVASRIAIMYKGDLIGRKSDVVPSRRFPQVEPISKRVM